MKRRIYHRPKPNSGWYKFSLNKGKTFALPTSVATELKEFNEVSDGGRRPFCDKYVNGVRID